MSTSVFGALILQLTSDSILIVSKGFHSVLDFPCIVACGFSIYSEHQFVLAKLGEHD